MKAIREEWFITLWILIITYNLIFYNSKSIGWIIISAFMIMSNVGIMLYRKKKKNENAF